MSRPASIPACRGPTGGERSCALGASCRPLYVSHPSHGPVPQGSAPPQSTFGEVTDVLKSGAGVLLVPTHPACQQTAGL